MAWIITTQFQRPAGIYTDGFVAAGLRLRSAPAWPNDGLSTHTALADQQSGPQRQDHGWQNFQGVTSHPTPARSWRIAMLTTAPLLQNSVFAVGTTNYSRGMGGMFPPTGTHGWATHVDGGPTFGLGVARVFLAPQLLPHPIVAPFLAGAIYVDPLAVPLGTLFLDRDGRADLRILAATRPFGLTAWVQAALIDNSLTRLAVTNANASTFQ